MAGLALRRHEVAAVVAVDRLVELDGRAEQDVGEIAGLDAGLDGQQGGA